MWTANQDTRPANSLHPPLNLEQIRKLIGVAPDPAIAKEIKVRGINFALNREIIDQLRRLAAGQQVIEILSLYLESNHAPLVTLKSDKMKVKQGQMLSLDVEGQDPDGDEIVYYWTTTAGVIEGSGSIVQLDTSQISTNSDYQIVVVNVTACDRKGGVTSASQSVTVQSRRLKVSVDASFDGKYVLVVVEGTNGEPVSSSGSIEIKLDAANNSTYSNNVVIGYLPGLPCRVTIKPIENVAESSFKEPPTISNEWERAIIRIRPKNSRRSIKFVVLWQLIGVG